ncbi:hypothetical protein ASF98_21910 [Arthrobacter sp. Leaf337]|nr:hypothetical protein ASF98_21910 [Arthrobacter sp. Leaf337]
MEHLDLFENNIQLTGRLGEVQFAHGHLELAQWFRTVPDEVSSHRILHSNWTERTGAEGTLDFLVAYQTPTADGSAGGSVISYQTTVSFADEIPRFVALDKTPILPNTKRVYAPTWAEHRVSGFMHALLGTQLTHAEAADALCDITDGVSKVDVWAPVPERSPVYDAFLTIGTADGNFHTAAWRFHDDGDTAFPAPLQIAPLSRSTVYDDRHPDARGTL